MAPTRRSATRTATVKAAAGGHDPASRASVDCGRDFVRFRKGLASALRRAEAAHGEHGEKRTGRRDESWPDWYAAYIGGGAGRRKSRRNEDSRAGGIMSNANSDFHPAARAEIRLGQTVVAIGGSEASPYTS